MFGKTARLVSLIVAIVLALVFMIYPVALSHDGHLPSHGLLSLAMIGISAGFVHGIGFTPESNPWRLVFHPVTAWLLMALAVLMLVV